MAKRALRGYAEYIEGDGETGGLVAVLRESFGNADGEDARAKNDGKPVDRVALYIEAESKAGKRVVFNREVSVTQKPADVAAVILRSLENDPGPSFEGDVRCYIRIAGKTERLSPGSYQRAIATGFVSPEIIEGSVVVPMPVWNQVVVPLLASVQQMAVECARGTHESAQAIGAQAAVVKSIGEGIGAAVGAFKQQTDSSALGTLVKVLTGAAGMGIPGAQTAANVANGAQQIAQSTVTAKLPILDRPALFGSGGAAVFDKPAEPFGSSFETTAKAAITPQRQLTSAEVLDWLAKANPSEAREVAGAYLDKTGNSHLKGLIP